MPGIQDLTINVGLAKKAIKGQVQSMHAELKSELAQQVADSKFADRQRTDAARAAARVRALDEKIATKAVVDGAKSAAAAAVRASQDSADASHKSAATRAQEARLLAGNEKMWAMFAAEEKDKADADAKAKRAARSKAGQQHDRKEHGAGQRRILPARSRQSNRSAARS